MGIWIERVTAAFSDLLLFQSQEDLREIEKLKVGRRGQFQFVGNGIDLGLYSRRRNEENQNHALADLNLNKNDIVVGTVGRLVYEKGFKEFFQVARQLGTKYKNLKFVVIGPLENDQKDSIKSEEIEALKRECPIAFSGWQDDVYKWYSMMDIFVLPSYREGIPRTCMEASAMELPVVATDIRGCREVVQHGVTGLLVPIKNTAALAKAVEELVRDRTLRIKMGEKGRKHIKENFDRSYVLERLGQSYTTVESLLDGKNPKSSKKLLSIDLEDWHQLVCRKITSKTASPSSHLLRQTDILLNLFDQFKKKATFFVVGRVAEQFPDLVKRISNQGHEIACHGYNHLNVHQFSREEFREDVKRTKNILEDLTGEFVIGHRAAEFSINEDTFWALEILAELGFRYDSSVFPIYSPRYGVPSFGRESICYRFQNGLELVEIPLATLRLAHSNIPIAGGSYFRLLPSWLIQWAFSIQRDPLTPMATYFHPYEFDSEPLDIFTVMDSRHLHDQRRGLFMNWWYNWGRRSVKLKLEKLLHQFEFVNFRNYLKEIQPVEARSFENQGLLSAKSV